jgi:alkanesulfonate monooxygenase SsuD/methylene tetrahydromethanopterin reductase-like flavin-dependent oxidoreductase (luciferase family)
MRFGYHATMCNPAFYSELAKAAEAVGFDTFTLPDSIWMAAVTTKLKFSTSVLKLPVRNPVLLAKQVTSIAVITGNRFELGIGLSPWKEDFDATGTDYKSRGERMAQMIEIIRGLSTGAYFEYESAHYHIPPIKLCPVPTKPVQILYGSHSEPGLRRAARLCDGWITGRNMADRAISICRSWAPKSILPTASNGWPTSALTRFTLPSAMPMRVVRIIARWNR